MLLDVGLQHSVEMLEFSVSDQSDDIYLSDRRESGWTESVTCLQRKKKKKNIYKADESSVQSFDRHACLGKKMSWLHLQVSRQLVKKLAACVDRAHRQSQTPLK